MLAQEPRVKIKSYSPLILMCIRCGATFDTSNKSGEEVASEVEKHLDEQHSINSQAA